MRGFEGFYPLHHSGVAGTVSEVGVSVEGDGGGAEREVESLPVGRQRVG
jgi:hypothetical protein